jgi:hypothetical protein
MSGGHRLAPDRVTAGAQMGGQQASALWMSGLSAFALIALFVSSWAGIHALTAPSMLVSGTVGVGSACFAYKSGLTPQARVALSFLASWSILTLGSMVMMLTQWRPGIAMFLVGAPAFAVHVHILLRSDLLTSTKRGTPKRATWHRPSAIDLSAVLAFVGAALCIVSAVEVRGYIPGVGGFLPHIGIIWYVGLLLVLVALGISKDETSLRWLYVLITVLVLTLTPAIVYGSPRSQSAEKHIDLIQRIRETHTLPSSAGIYEGWRGFFAAMAWMADVARVKDTFGFATYWPAIIGVFRLAAMKSLVDHFVKNSGLAWFVTAVAVLADGLSNDYFSPQSIGFVLGLTALSIALSDIDDYLRVFLLILAGCTISVTHQLSPFIVGGALVVLSCTRAVRLWWSPACVLIPALVWAGLHRGQLSHYVSIDTVGRASNFRSPQAFGGTNVSKLGIVRLSVDSVFLSVLILGLLAAGGLVMQRRSLVTWGVALCPAVGLALVAVNPYGNEGIFRATLFGLPWLAILAGIPLAALGGRSTSVALRSGLVVILAACFLLAAFGLDGSTVIRKSDRRVLEGIEQQARANPAEGTVLLVLGAGDVPISVPTIPANEYVPGRWKLPPPGTQELPDQVITITARLKVYAESKGDVHSIYVLWSPSSRLHDREYGRASYADFDGLRSAFEDAAGWHVAKQDGSTILFELA